MFWCCTAAGGFEDVGTFAWWDHGAFLACGKHPGLPQERLVWGLGEVMKSQHGSWMPPSSQQSCEPSGSWVWSCDCSSPAPTCPSAPSFHLATSLLLISAWSSPKPDWDLCPFRCRCGRQDFSLSLHSHCFLTSLQVGHHFPEVQSLKTEPWGTSRSRTPPSSSIPKWMGHFWIYGLLLPAILLVLCVHLLSSNTPVSLLGGPG